MQKYSRPMGYPRSYVEKLKRFNKFAILFVPKWFQAANASDAQVVDLDFVRKMETYRTIDCDVATAVLKTLSGHLDFLAPEFCFLSLTSKKVSVEEKKNIAAKILSIPTPESFQPAPTKPLVPINSLTELPMLAQSERVHLPFKLLGVSKEFLHLEPTEWANDSSYQRIAKFVQRYIIVNDVAENAIQLATDFNEKVTRNETQRQYLYHTVKQQRRDCSDLRRKSLQPSPAPFSAPSSTSSSSPILTRRHVRDN